MRALAEHLCHQLSFLTQSCRDFDEGNTAEAVRIALALRVLFHQTGSSHALIHQMGLADKLELLSSIPPISDEEGLRLSFGGLVLSVSGFEPALELAGHRAFLPWRQWWNQVVFVQDGKFSRQDIIKAAANKDGGAHVHPTPDSDLENFQEGIGTMNGKQIGDIHFTLLRQFGYEVLASPDLIDAAG